MDVVDRIGDVLDRFLFRALLCSGARVDVEVLQSQLLHALTLLQHRRTCLLVESGIGRSYVAEVASVRKHLLRFVI